MQLRPKICLLIINYNGFKFLPTYLNSLFLSCNDNSIPLIVTDDNSTDNSISYLSENNYDYTINTGDKKGFAANVNNGIRYARSKDSFDYYIISNNDVKIDKSLFSALFEAIAVISERCKLHGLIGFDEILPRREDYFNTFNYNIYDPGLIKEVCEIPGFFFIIKRELVDAIGYMDEEYFMYGEDNDYFKRTYKGGFKIYNTGLPVMHYSEGSSTNSKLTSWYVYRNAFLCAQKNSSLFEIVKLIIAFGIKIYNPFYNDSHPSNRRIKRNGFFYNNYLLIKSLVWNLQYYLKNGKRLS